ncbi:MAG: hypothetical protein HKO66_05930 [Saprospiraceae bacterium]|nr:putative porin [Bacteroidia bacterium]NNE16819.1 hypothetical protein [Saprospiraceae bacterium]NNL91750.1 hypothetical protein [Saprospiraceae bacterium]
MKHLQSLILIIFVSNLLYSQTDSTFSKVSFEMDYRFRAEQDWNSRKSDGTFRNDRSRLRYRLRAGATYSDKHYTFGVRMRTGDPNKQQDPQLTLGKGLKEFGTLPVGFEKAFFQFNKHNFKFWLGKNTFPFKKNNEMFWSDNVFPEGITLDKSFVINDGFLKAINLIGGHYILSSNDGSLLDDAYFQGIQTNFNSRNDRFKLSSALYVFRNIPNIPDGEHTFLLPYSILHLSGNCNINNFYFDFDYYKNLNNYNNNSNIDQSFRNQTTGYTIGIQYGNINAAKKWMYKLTYAYLQRYSVLDYMAQNDWARWDYSSSNSPDGRLSNMQGIEWVVAYSITEKINLVAKYYFVEQLIPLGVSNENGQRIRFDINVKI